MSAEEKRRAHAKLANEVVKQALALWRMREKLAQQSSVMLLREVDLARKGFVRLPENFSAACHALEKFETTPTKPACRTKPASDPEARARARRAAKKPCLICNKSTPLCDRAVYLAHGNGGAYGCAPAHKECVKKFGDAVEGWNEDPGWYVRGDEPKLSDVGR